MARLIINADDYGYYPWVSAGILDTLRAGTVTATGVLANGPDFAAAAEALRALPEVDTGVHLNATWGLPLTDALPRSCLRPDGTLPAKGALVGMLLNGRLPLAALHVEWRAQVQRCVAAGLQPRFLNSHEHVHQWPSLRGLVQQLAAEFGIVHVRCSAAAPGPGGGLGGRARSAALLTLGLVGPRPLPAPRLLGLGASGRLDLRLVERIVTGLRGDGVYELLCHPGRAVGYGAAPRDLLDYHDWSGELDCFTDPRMREILRKNAVRLTHYRYVSLLT